MLTLIIRDFVVSLGDKEDAKHFLDRIEKEINEKELRSYCHELREYLASDSCSLKGSSDVPHGT